MDFENIYKSRRVILEMLQMRGFDTSKYQQEMEDPDFMGWEVAIYRSTFDSFSSSEGATTTVDSIIEIYEERYCYPNSAYVRSRFRADSFSAVPKRKFLTRGIKVDHGPVGL